MKVKSAILICALLAVVAVALPASAQTNTWDIYWLGNDKPENSAFAWDTGKVTMPSNQVTVGPANIGNPYPFARTVATGEVNVYDKDTGATQTFYRQRLNPDYEGGVTIETRIEGRYATSTSNLKVARIASKRGVVEVAWNIPQGQILITKGTAGGGNVILNYPAGVYHTFRLTEDSTGFKLWIDGELKKTGTVAAYSSEPADDRNEIGFGELGTFKVEYFVDYCYIELTGAYGPSDPGAPQLPSTYFVRGPVATIPSAANQAVITWVTSAPCNRRVYYRLKRTPAPPWSEYSEGGMNVNHSVTLNNLIGGLTYEYYVSCTDESGNTIESGIKEFTPNAEMHILPGISWGPRADSMGDGSMKFTWRATVKSDSYVYYREAGNSGSWTEVYDPTYIERWEDGNLSTLHVITIPGSAFTPGKTYEWYCRSVSEGSIWGEDSASGERFTYDFKFVDGPYAIASGTSCNIDFKTFFNTDGSTDAVTVKYRMLGSPTWNTVTQADTGMDHRVQLTGLTVPAQYEYQVICKTAVPGFSTLTSEVLNFETYQYPGGSVLTNGDFETGSLDPWVPFGANIGVAQDCPAGFDCGQPAHSGVYRVKGGVDGIQDPRGIYQVIPGNKITGNTLYASAYVATHELDVKLNQIYGYTWNDYYETHTAILFRIGIDPTGGTDHTSPNIIWSAPVYTRQKGKPYIPIAVSAPVTPGQPATVFVRAIDNTVRKRLQIPLFIDDVWAGFTPGVEVPTVTVTENSPTSVTFSWTTSLPTTSMVQHTWDGSSTLYPNSWFYYDDKLTTNHSVTINNRFLPDVNQKFCVQSLSGLGWSITPLQTFKTQPINALFNGDFEASGLAWDQELGFGMGAIPWVKFGQATGIARDGTYPMHGIVSYSPTHSLIFEEGYSNAMNYSGAYQRIKVGTANVNQTYMLRAKALTYCEGLQSDVNNRLGIDPTGGTDPNSPTVVWGPWVSTSRAWQDAICAAIAGEGATNWNGYITVFLQTEHRWPLSLNLTMFDDVSLELAVPKTTIGDALWAQPGWPVDLGAGGNMIVTKTELLAEQTGIYKYAWIQSDDRANGIKVRLDKCANADEVVQGCRVRVRGNTNVRALMDPNWGEAEVVALKVDILGTDDDPIPLDMPNKSLSGAPIGIQRGANGAAGANNLGLLVKTTGRVTEVGVDGFTGKDYFLIDDGSNLQTPIHPPSGPDYVATGLKVYSPDDFPTLPAVGQYVSVIGASALEVYDPTPGLGAAAGVPNGSGDEILIRCLRLRNGNDWEVIPEP